MFKILMILIIYSIFTGCSIDKKEYKNIKIVIEQAQSYKYDLYNGIYWVYYTDKSPTKIKFHLSDEEINAVMNKYFDLDINRITINTMIEDECMISPDILTILNVKTKYTNQRIEISEGCDKFSTLNSNRANRVKKFLKFIEDILKTKTEIKNAPKSNVHYM